MPAKPIAPVPAAHAHRSTLPDVLLDGLFTGMIGAGLVALWFLALDTIEGHPLRTPALLGAVLLHGTLPGAGPVVLGPAEIAAYTAFHLSAFVVFGIVFSALVSLFDRFPIVFFVLLVAFLALMLGFLVLDAALGASLMGQLRPWTVAVANLLAAGGMVLYQWRRHPAAFRSVGTLWEDPDGVPGR